MCGIARYVGNKINLNELDNEQSKFLFRILSINLFLKYSSLCKK